jgi:hypothetical protein
LLIADLLRGRSEYADDDDYDDEDGIGGGGMAKLLLGRRAMRRNLVRKRALSELLSN